MPSDRKPTVARARAAKDVLLRATMYRGVELQVGDPVPTDLSVDEKARLKRIGAIR